jgi:hypothetical protein
MLLIAEIVLTIFAWKRGWRWYALIPLGLCLLIGFILGASISSSGGSINDLNGASVVLDVIAVIVLIVLCSVKPKSTEF